MGKFARSIARIHDLTTDNLIDGAKATGRAVRKVSSPVVSKVGESFHNGVAAVKFEHRSIEQERIARKAVEAKAKAAYQAELDKNQSHQPSTV